MKLPDGGTAVRFAIVGVAAFTLAGLVYAPVARLAPVTTAAFPRFLLLVTLVKLLGDLVYYLVSFRRREVVHLDDYLGNDFLTFYRFALPLAIVQAYALGQALIPLAYNELWRGPGAATALYLTNRWLIEQAEERRRRMRGGVPVVGQRSTS